MLRINDFLNSSSILIYSQDCLETETFLQILAYKTRHFYSTAAAHDRRYQWGRTMLIVRRPPFLQCSMAHTEALISLTGVCFRKSSSPFTSHKEPRNTKGDIFIFFISVFAWETWLSMVHMHFCVTLHNFLSLSESVQYILQQCPQ